MRGGGRAQVPCCAMNNVSIGQVLAGTPTWVFVLLAYLFWMGATRLKQGVRNLARIWITPGIFIVWGLIGLFQRPGSFSEVLMRWAVGLVLGGALGAAFAIPMKVDRPRRRVLLSGSVLPLLRVLIIFGAHYALRAAAAIHPDASGTYLNWDIYVSGASAGYFLGWSIRFLMSYAKAPQVDLSTVQPAAPRPV
jgi:hypothetical protein